MLRIHLNNNGVTRPAPSVPRLEYWLDGVLSHDEGRDEEPQEDGAGRSSQTNETGVLFFISEWFLLR